MRHNIPKLAHELVEQVQRPEHAGQTWNWVKIGLQLEVSAPVAKQVVYWLRMNNTEFWWTIGTVRSEYETMPVRSTREAFAGLLNQLLHLETRLRSQGAAWACLAKVDPDPRWAGIAEREARWYQRSSEEVHDRVGTLNDLMDLNAPA